jgi:FkbM family methyltransferase
VTSLVLKFTSMVARIMPVSLRRSFYRLGPVAGWIRGGLNRAAPQGLTTIPVAAGALAGAQLLLDLQTEKDYWLGTYEPELQAAISSLAQPGMVVYDIGANIGYVSLLLRRKVGEKGQVYAFEPLPENLERLRTNLALNGLTSQVMVVAGAVVERSKPVRFLVGPSGGMGKVEGAAGRQGISYRDSILVDGISLDEFVYDSGNPTPDLIKMDIEGGEALAVKGMERLLHEARPVLLMELHGPRAAEVVWSALTGAGYRICRMSPGLPVVTSLNELDWKAYLVALPGAGNERDRARNE